MKKILCTLCLFYLSTTLSNAVSVQDNQVLGEGMNIYINNNAHTNIPQLPPSQFNGQFPIPPQKGGGFILIQPNDLARDTAININNLEKIQQRNIYENELTKQNKSFTIQKEENLNNIKDLREKKKSKSFEYHE